MARPARSCRCRGGALPPAEPERLRLFVALDLPEPARAALEAYAGELAAADPALRAVRGDALHITLCFLGARPAAEVAAIAAELVVAAGAQAPVITLDRVLALPARRPNVIAVALEDHGGSLAAIQATAEQALVGLGVYARERRPFLAHVTVARVRRGARLRRGAEFPAPPSVAPQRCPRLVLYDSRTEPAGARYQPLWSAGLR